jgi:ribosomal protein L29
MAKANELRQKTDAELSSEVLKLRQEIYRLKNKAVLENDSKVYAERRMKKKDVARALTILRERELQNV